MTIIDTDVPGVQVEVTETVHYGPQRPSQVRLQAWSQRPTRIGDPLFDHMIDLRFTPEQADQTADALREMAHNARVANIDQAAFEARRHSDD